MTKDSTAQVVESSTSSSAAASMTSAAPASSGTRVSQDNIILIAGIAGAVGLASVCLLGFAFWKRRIDRQNLEGGQNVRDKASLSY